MLRILIAGPKPPPEGGVATSIIHLREAVAGRCATAHFDTSTHGDVAAAGRWKAMNVVRAAQLWPALAHQVRTSRPDLVHVETGGYLGLLKSCALLRATGGTPTVLSVHSPTLEQDFRDATPVGARLIRSSLERLDAIRLEHQGQADQLVRVHPPLERVPMHVIPNFVPLGPAPARREPGEGDMLRLLSVGAVGRRKGTYELLRAVADLHRSGARVSLRVLGPEERPGDLEQLRRLRAELGLQEIVELKGAVPLAEVREHLSEAEVFALPAHAEGLPLAILEAMASGLALAVTDVGGIGGVVRQPGLDLLRPGDVAGLTNLIRRFHDEPGLRRACGDANRRRIEEEFSAHALAERFVSMWQQAVRRSPA